MPRFIAIASLVAVLHAMCASEAAPPGFRPGQYIGYWHDGSGVFRDCTPVATWNEWDFKGKDKKEEVPDKERRVNIAWKVPHYNWCNGGMIITGGILVAMSDRGGYGFYADRVAEFAGAEMFAYDPATGKELWKTDLDHWDLVPQGAELRKEVLALNRSLTEIYRAWAPLGMALRERSKGLTLDETRYRELSKTARAFFPDLPADLAALKGTVYDSSGYEQLHFWKTLLPKYHPNIAEIRNRILKAGYLVDPWAGKYDPLGINMQTPVSDGNLIYTHTAYGGVFCLDKTGKIIWKKWLGGGWDRGAAIPSPVLAGDHLIIVGVDDGKKGEVRMALDKKTGKEVWRAPFGGSYQTGPVVLDLPIAGDAARPVRVLYFQDGKVLRAKDGKELASGIGAMYTGRPYGVDRDIVVIGNTLQDGGGAAKVSFPEQPGHAALRFTAPSEDKVEAAILWQGLKLDGLGAGVVVRDGVVFALDRNKVSSFDLITGKPLATASGTLAKTHHMAIIAGDLLIGLDERGCSAVVQISADGKTLKPIGTSRLGDRVYGQAGGATLDKKFSYGCQFFASGNRIFIRSMTDLYCIGDPSQPLRLSKEHQ
mgnify:CR=1 FL=1